MVLIVHTSRSCIGWVCWVAQSFINTLIDTISWNGTIMVSTQSPGLSHPSNPMDPPIPKTWWSDIKKIYASL